MTLEEKHQKLSIDEFVVRAIKIITAQKGRPGVHAVWDGLNELLREYYGKDIDVKTIFADLKTRGVIEVIPFRGGPRVYLPKTIPTSEKQQKLLQKILSFEENKP